MLPKKFLLFILALFAWVPLLVVLTYRNSSPLGDTIRFRHDLISDQRWAEKLTKNGENPAVLEDVTSSFLLKVPEGYSSLGISAKFINSYNSVFQLAVKTNEGTMSRNIRSLDYKPLNDFPWPYIREGEITLYQKHNGYETLQEFFDNPPLDSTIAFYEFSDLDRIQREPAVLSDYKPSKKLQNIGHTLRGSHTLYTYIKNEELYFEFEKQDINWVEGKDVLIVDVTNAESLFTQTVPDDGIVDDSGQVENIQKIKIRIPDLPEGVYRIVLKQPGGDALIKNIKTRQHKLVFASKIYLADSDLYENVSPKPATIYSKGARLTAITREEFSTQELIINDQTKLTLDEAGKPYSIDLPLGLHEIFTPKSNVQLTDNYFAFSKEAYFEPFKPSLYPYNPEMDLESFDYLITSYTPPVNEDGWLVSNQSFDLSKIEIADRLVPVSLIIPEIYRAETDEERVIVDYLDIELTRPAPENPKLAHKILAFFPKLIKTASAVEPRERLNWLKYQLSPKRVFADFFRFTTVAASEKKWCEVDFYETEISEAKEHSVPN